MSRVSRNSTTGVSIEDSPAGRGGLHLDAGIQSLRHGLVSIDAKLRPQCWEKRRVVWAR